MNIDGLENINTIFSIFHDGEIGRCVKTDSHLEFDVHIQYLAERINPTFRTFSVALDGVEALYFTTWPDDANAEPVVVADVESIFTKELEILSGEIENGAIKVACNQPLPGLGYCGGFLNLKAKSAFVKDEAGKEYSIEELCSLSESYWNEWSNKNKA
jgi:hypothetical protein